MEASQDVLFWAFLLMKSVSGTCRLLFSVALTGPSILLPYIMYYITFCRSFLQLAGALDNGWEDPGH